MSHRGTAGGSSVPSLCRRPGACRDAVGTSCPARLRARPLRSGRHGLAGRMQIWAWPQQSPGGTRAQPRQRRRRRARGPYRRASAIVVHARAIAGCMVGPDFVRPKAEVPATFAEAPAARCFLGAPSRWWQAFGIRSRRAGRSGGGGEPGSRGGGVADSRGARAEDRGVAATDVADRPAGRAARQRERGRRAAVR